MMSRTISANQLVVVATLSEAAARMAPLAVHRVAIAVAGIVLEVRFGDARWAALFADRYADQLTGKPANVVHYVVQDVDGYAFWTPGRTIFGWRDGELTPAGVAFLADATSVSEAIATNPELVSFHAAVLEYRGSALAIVGDSTAGKTTTAIACARRGLKLFSDERCILANGLVVPFARSVNIRGSALPMLTQTAFEGDTLRSNRLNLDPGDHSYPISWLFGREAIAQPAPLRAIFLLADKSTEPRIEPTERYEAISALNRWMQSSSRGLQRTARLLESIRNTSVYRCRLGTPDATALEIRATLDGLPATKELAHAG